ncbi:hypothetical protein O5D80_001362 [Batrachochytrium dendrobatidis]|nr:hypothetical protein O5D80_001362 [Batrachochytrium dendrobatidis]
MLAANTDAVQKDNDVANDTATLSNITSTFDSSIPCLILPNDVDAAISRPATPVDRHTRKQYSLLAIFLMLAEYCLELIVGLTKRVLSPSRPGQTFLSKTYSPDTASVIKTALPRLLSLKYQPGYCGSDAVHSAQRLELCLMRLKADLQELLDISKIAFIIDSNSSSGEGMVSAQTNIEPQSKVECLEHGDFLSLKKLSFAQFDSLRKTLTHRFGTIALVITEPIRLVLQLSFEISELQLQVYQKLHRYPFAESFFSPKKIKVDQRLGTKFIQQDVLHCLVLLQDTIRHHRRLSDYIPSKLLETDSQRSTEPFSNNNLCVAIPSAPPPPPPPPPFPLIIQPTPDLSTKKSGLIRSTVCPIPKSYIPNLSESIKSVKLVQSKHFETRLPRSTPNHFQADTLQYSNTDFLPSKSGIELQTALQSGRRKLRTISTPRTPSGTPIPTEKSRQCIAPNDIIHAALLKKFKSIQHN